MHFSFGVVRRRLCSGARGKAVILARTAGPSVVPHAIAAGRPADYNIGMPLIDLANPTRFLAFSGRLLPWLWGVAIVGLAVGLYLSFFVAPPDYLQGDMIRVMFIHVPFAWLAMACYALMAVAALGTLVWRHPLADVTARSAAPIGAAFAFLTLITGSLWGRPTWGAWWVWDARLTSELILLFLYIGFMALQAAIDEPRRADKAGAVLALVGVINIPIIYFSVQWWNTLHQGSSINFKSAPSMAMTMLVGMLVLALAFWAYTIAVTLVRLRCIVQERERHGAWELDNEEKPQ